MWVLIVVVLFAGTNGVNSSTTVAEFYSSDSCNNALKAIQAGKAVYPPPAGGAGQSIELEIRAVCSQK